MLSDCLTDTRGVFDPRHWRAGSTHLRAHGTPDPDRAYVRTRKPRAKYTGPSPAKVRDCTPREHTNHVAHAEHNMLVAQRAVKTARAEGADRATLAALAATARERRAAWLALTGGVEGRMIDVNQGSEVNPMIAV